MFLNFLTIIIIFFINPTFALEFPNQDEIVKVEIIPSKGIFNENGVFYFGIKFDLKDGWKTYWKNPGDAGAPLNISWEDNIHKPNDIEILYPFPKKFIDKGVTTIGYDSQVVFPVKINSNGQKKINRKIQLDYLICKDICIPYSETRILNIDFNKKRDSLIFSKSLRTVPEKNQNYFTISYNNISKEKLKIIIDGYEKLDSLNVYGYSDETNIKIEKLENSFEVFLDDDAANLTRPILFSISDGENFEEVSLAIKKEQRLLYFILLALAGGFILNFMPCVLPVLSLKLYSFLKIPKDNFKNIRINCFFIIAGIVASFLVLASLVILLKSIGESVGWGFQFQNRYFLFFILIIIMLFSLNLLGFFEIFLSQRLLNKINTSLGADNHSSQFFSGAFATLLATPCSAPFLGTAIGFSMGASTLEILLIFLSIALGFSLPYLFFIIIPKIITFFPKPGKWMENLRFFLGLLLLFSFIWLVNLFNVNHTLILVLTTMILVFAYLRRKTKFVMFLSILFLLTNILILSDRLFVDRKDIKWEEFREESLLRYIEDNRIVLIDVTADWCVTCNFNKVTTLNSKTLAEFFIKYKVVTIRADWTNKDKKILDFINQYGRYGIPVNLIYGPKNKEGILLPEILSKDIVISELLKVGVNNDN